MCHHARARNRLRMGANDYLQLRRGRWFVRIRLPADLAKTLGRTHIVRSLGTSDLTLARQRRRAALGAILTWQASQTVLDGWTPSRAWRTVADGAPDAASAPDAARALSVSPSGKRPLVQTIRGQP